MEYRVSRDMTELHVKPCARAVRKRYVWKDHRSFSSPDYFHEKNREEWFEEGENHRIENGHIVRDLVRMGWFISVDNLEELHTLFRECSLLSISLGTYGDDPHIILDLQP